MSDFDDLLAANQRFADEFDRAGFDGVAHAGVALLTCVDSRIAPLRLLGLKPGDAKILRNPGATLTSHEIEGLVIAVHTLQVTRILIVPHTKCTWGMHTADELRAMVAEAIGRDTEHFAFHAVEDPLQRLHEDVHLLRVHPLIGPMADIGGFMYDVDTGLLEQVA
jgi:carbonic anhydrase